MTASLVSRIDASVLRGIAVKPPAKKAPGQAAIISALGPLLPDALASGGITSQLRIAHFLAQAAHETDSFCTLEEYATGAAYEGREDLGNVNSGDGKRYKGRGIFQLTGRFNYRVFGELLGVDLERQPERAAEPAISLDVAIAYWNRKNLGPLADDDDLLQITRRINGGTTGLADRRSCLGRAKTMVAALAAAGMPSTIGRPVLRRGSEGDAVEHLQARLRKLDYVLTLDGDFGPQTEGAVKTFQKRGGLLVDGIVGAKTWSALYAGAEA